MDWDHLRFLLALQRHGSLSGAARALKVNQTTVGRRLDELQAQLGTRLFDRQASGYRLTKGGQRACAIVVTMESAALDLERKLGGQDAGIEGAVRLTVPAGFVHLLAPALAELHAEHPRLVFEVLVDQLSVNLVQREADIAIRMADPAHPSLVARRLGELPWGLYVSRSYLQRRGTPPADLAGHDVVGFDASLARTPGGAWLTANAPAAKVVMRTNNVISALECAAAGLGIAAAPGFLAARLPELERLPRPALLGKGGVFLVTLADLAKVPRIRAALDALARHLRPQITLRG